MPPTRFPVVCGSITTRISNYCTRVNWVKANSGRIIDNIKTKMSVRA